MRTIAVSNAKGGTGKTSLAVHLGVGAARAGLRTLLVDLDFQANLTAWLLGHKLPAGTPGVAEVLETGEAPAQDDGLHPVPGQAGLWVLPSTPDLRGAEYSVASKPAGQMNLRRGLAGLRKTFDLIVVDCAPNLGVTVVSGLCAADAVFAPVTPAFLSLSGLAELEATVSRLRQGFKVPTRVRGYVLFAVDERKGLPEAVRQLLRKEGRDKLLASEVRTSTAGEQLPERHLTAWDEGADARGAEDYPPLLAEVLERAEAR